MLNFAYSLGFLIEIIADAVFIPEERRQFTDVDITILIDSSTDYGTAMFAIPHGVIRTTTKK